MKRIEASKDSFVKTFADNIIGGQAIKKYKEHHLAEGM